MEDKPTDIFRAFRCVAFDHITSYCFGWSLHLIKAPDFKSDTVEQLHVEQGTYQYLKHFRLIKIVLVTVMPLIAPFMREKESKGFALVYEVHGALWLLSHSNAHDCLAKVETEGAD